VKTVSPPPPGDWGHSCRVWTPPTWWTHCHTANGSFRFGHMPQNTHGNGGHSTKKTLLSANSLCLGKFVAADIRKIAWEW